MASAVWPCPRHVTPCFACRRVRPTPRTGGMSDILRNHNVMEGGFGGGGGTACMLNILRNHNVTGSGGGGGGLVCFFCVFLNEGKDDIQG